MRSILFTLTTLAFVALTKAFPTGSGTCNSNQTVIEGVPGQPMGTMKELGYSFAVTMENNNYIPGGPPVKFCVHGANQFKGLLLYALDTTPDKNHVGQWNIPDGQPYKVLELTPKCAGDPKGTITHSDPSLKSNPCFEWVPPQTDVGPLSFVGTIVQSKADGFQIIRDPNVFTAKGGNDNNNNNNKPPPQQKCIIKTLTLCAPDYKPTNYDPPKYENTDKPLKNEPTYEKPTGTEPTYGYGKPTGSGYQNEPTYGYGNPTGTDGSAEPLQSFNPPKINAANGITHSESMLLLQLLVSSLILYLYH